MLERFGQPPAVPAATLTEEVQEAVEAIFGASLRENRWGHEQVDGLRVIAGSGDPRLVWLISDLMRVASSAEMMQQLVVVTERLLGIEIDDGQIWGVTTDHLIAWKIPAPPRYLDYKRQIYTLVVPQWEKLFVPGQIDWRHVSWGGVGIDERPFGATEQPCNCIPAADNPKVTSAEDAGWLKDSDYVFGLQINGEFRAYPRRIMEVREMVNDTLGGRNLGIPYCTLCGSAQAYFTDRVPAGVERPVLRTSGLLIRSNKVMYDVNSFSVFDTFLGTAVTGPLAEQGVQLPQASMVTTTWGEWRKAHPTTTVLAEELALGRDFDFRNGRDANGPIFPVGDVDPRLSVHEDILGVVTESGQAVAFPVAQALAALKGGDPLIYEGIEVIKSAGGLRAISKQGTDLGSHQAFWFAWSQFHPSTKLWTSGTN